jgi:type II secretory pathway component PulL
MKRVEIRVRDESDELISEQELELEIGSGSFDAIEQARERLRWQGFKRLEADLLEREQARFVEAVKKGGATA